MPDYSDIALGLLGGLNRGIEAYSNQRRSLADRDAEMALRGLIRGEGNKWVKDPVFENLEKKKRMDELKARAILEGRVPKFDETGGLIDAPYSEDQVNYFKTRAEFDPYGLKSAQATKAKTDAADAQRKALAAPVPGFKKGPNYVADDTEERAIRTAYADKQKFDTVMDSLITKVQAASPADLANPLSPTSKSITNDLRDLQLIYKGEAFAKLGVLAGPDMKILEDIIENPGTVSNLISGKEGVLERYAQAKDRVNQGFGARVQSLGLVPEAGEGLVKPKAKGLVKPATKTQPSGEDQEAIQWATQNPNDPRAQAILKLHGVK